ncbi:35765_t:CDS:1, partial [Racocetra persica]
FDLITDRFTPKHRTIIVTIFLIASIYIFSPIAYGSTWEKSSCANSKWLSTWDYDCNLYVRSHLNKDTNSTGIEITNPEFSDIKAFDKRAVEDKSDEQCHEKAQGLKTNVEKNEVKQCIPRMAHPKDFRVFLSATP